MERRNHRRFPRRVEVRFWRQGENTPHSSFTTNVSRTGLFLGSASALVPGERLRLEVVDRDNGFFIEGQVARVHRVSLALRHVEQPGVGVRFLTSEELIEQLLRPVAHHAARSRAVEPPPTPQPERQSPPQAEGSRIGTSPPAGRDGETRDGAEKPPPRVVPVTFVDASAFLSVYHRDIQSGGLFVSTEEPAELRETVWIELHLPLEGERPELIESTVVQRFEPQAAVGEGKNYLSGMALQFSEPERVLESLKPHLAKLRR